MSAPTSSAVTELRTKTNSFVRVLISAGAHIIPMLSPLDNRRKWSRPSMVFCNTGKGNIRACDVTNSTSKHTRRQDPGHRIQEKSKWRGCTCAQHPTNELQEP